MRVLLSFTGFHDPFATHGEDALTGPILTILAERSFDKVILFSTPKLQSISLNTEKEILVRYPSVSVEILDVPLVDPTHYSTIIKSIRNHFVHLQKLLDSPEYFIGISSGTPQIHACWLMLVTSGEIPAILLQTTPPQFVEEGKKLVREIDISGQEFPNMAIRTGGIHKVKDDADENLVSARTQLGIVGEDPSFINALKEAAIYAEYDDIHLLLFGETGTGKECFTNLVHLLSRRANKPMVTVNCSSIPSELVESHLFGHKKGSFTGATNDRDGKFTAADGGILFLDELGELPVSAQAKLLRVLEYGEIEPVGESRPHKVNVRVIAATNRNLREMVSNKKFREDLYQRFGASVSIPALRQRRSDIPLLAKFLLDEWNKKQKKQRTLSSTALIALTRHQWTGNIRELRRVIAQSAMLTGKTNITENDLRFDLPIASNTAVSIPEPEPGFQLSEYLDSVKGQIVSRALEKENRVQARAAKLLGWTPQALGQYLKSTKT